MDNPILQKYKELTESQSSRRDGNKGHILLLLAAGFSYNQGYPLGSNINDEIRKLEKNEYQFDDEERLKRVLQDPKSKKDLSDANITLQKVYNYLVDVIKHYTSSLQSIDDFSYEDLYDGIDYSYDVNRKFDIMSEEYRKLSIPFVDDFLTHEQIVYRLPIVLNQIISHIIEKSQDSSLCDDVSRDIGYYDMYSNFLQYLQNKSESNIIDVFTLNHDTFFDSFKNINGLGDKICDGFDDYGSEYYGHVQMDGTDYRCRLERYTGRYSKPIRLYKIHGSLNYYQYFKEKRTNSVPLAIPQSFIKLKRGVTPLSVQKGRRSKMRYNNSLTPISHAAFLSGMEIKKKKYKSPFYYEKILKHFKNRISVADTIIIVGYSGNDVEINNYLSKYKSTKNVYIIDVKPGESVYLLRGLINAKLLVGDLNEKIKELI